MIASDAVEGSDVSICSSFSEPIQFRDLEQKVDRGALFINIGRIRSAFLLAARLRKHRDDKFDDFPAIVLASQLSSRVQREREHSLSALESIARICREQRKEQRETFTDNKIIQHNALLLSSTRSTRAFQRAIFQVILDELVYAERDANRRCNLDEIDLEASEHPSQPVESASGEHETTRKNDEPFRSNNRRDRVQASGVLVAKRFDTARLHTSSQQIEWVRDRLRDRSGHTSAK